MKVTLTKLARLLINFDADVLHYIRGQNNSPLASFHALYFVQ